jgi:rRNA-processing protein FCF1
MKTVVLDTNFLLIPAQFKVDIFVEIERVCRFPYQLKVVEGTLGELQKLMMEGDAKERKAAKMAFSLFSQHKVGILNISGEVDSAIASLPKGTVVATQDQRLKRVLKERGFSLVVLRQQKYLQFIE